MRQGSEGAYGEWVCADVVCHQMAHQWFGNLATAPNWAESTGSIPLRRYMGMLKSLEFESVGTRANLREPVHVRGCLVACLCMCECLCAGLVRVGVSARARVCGGGV